MMKIEFTPALKFCLTPYRLQLAKQENRNKYLNNTLILFVNNIYSAG